MKPFWNKRKLSTLKELIKTQTVREIAEFFNTSVEHIRYSMEHFGINRTKKEWEFVQSKRVKFEGQEGDKNPNWKGGVSKDHYRYRKRQKERYPERIKAERAIKQAKRSGIISPNPCFICGSMDHLEASPSDLRDPIGSINWYCRRCNRTRKRK